MSDSKYKKLREKAKKLLEAKGLSKPQEYYNDIEKLVEELNIHQIELEMQNVELQETNQRLANEQNRYKDLYMNAPVAYFTLNKTGNIIELNKAAADLLDIPLQRFKFTSIFPYLDKSSKNEFSMYFKRIFSSEKAEYGEINFRDSNNNLVVGTLSSSTYYDDIMQDYLVRCTIIDISKTKNFEKQILTQKKLIESENRMRDLFEKIGVPMLLIDPENGKIVDANPAAGDFYGYKLDSLREMNISKINQLSADEVKYAMQKTKQEGLKFFNFKHRLKSGLIKDVEVYSTAVTHEDKKLLYSIIHDVSGINRAKSKISRINSQLLNTIEELDSTNDELNSANEIIRRERHQFLSILDNIPQMIYVSDLDTYEVLFANKRMKELISENVIGKKCYEIIRNRTSVCEFCTNKFIKDNNEPYFWDNYNATLNKQFYIMDRKIEWTNQKEVRFELAIDITKQKRVEKQLRKSEEKYRLITENASDVIWVWNVSQDKFTYINPTVEHFHGYNPQEALTKRIENFLHPEHTQKIRERMKRIISEFSKQSKSNSLTDKFETLGIRKNGTKFWVEIQVSYSYNKNNEIEVLGITRDIDERKRHEQKIENRLHYEEQLMMFSNTILLDKGNTLAKGLEYLLTASQCSRVYIFENHVNNAGKLAMKQTHEVVADNITSLKNYSELQSLIYEDDGFGRWQKKLSENNIINAIVAELPEKEKQFLESLEIKSILVIPIWVNNHWYGFIGFDDNHICKKWSDADVDLLQAASQIIGLFIENQKIKNKLLKNNEALKEAVATKDRFISILGHDLRNPIATVMGFSNYILDNYDDSSYEEKKEYTTYIHQSTKLTYDLLNNILEWSRVEQNKIPFTPKTTDIFSLIMETYLLVESSAKSKGVKIDLKINENSLASIDREMIKTVIRNLVSNAIKFTPTNGKITISTQKSNNNIFIEIEDTGVGMSKTTIDTLFKIGETKSKEGTNGELGTGFGLLLCKEFVDKHNGDILVESEPEKGSKFIIKLPIS